MLMGCHVNQVSGQILLKADAVHICIDAAECTSDDECGKYEKCVDMQCVENDCPRKSKSRRGKGRK